MPSANPLESPLITVDELADYLKVSKETLYQQRHRRQEPGCLGFRIGKEIRYSASDVAAWLERTKAAETRV